MYDSQGNARNLTMYFSKTAPNEWRIDARMSGGPEGAPNYAFTNIANGTNQDGEQINFGFTSDGRLNNNFNNFEIDLDDPNGMVDATGTYTANPAPAETEFGNELTSQQIQIDFA
ncbi:MAG: flagellar basal body FlgE domain-containing protein, partial [Halomonas sp.]